MDPIPEDEFVELVEQALDELPEPMLAHLDNVAIVVEDAHPEEPDLLGIYEGIPLIERMDDYFAGALPDRIAIFRLPLCAMCEDLDDLRDEIAVTVVHEIAHHHGIDDDHLHELGWG
ncbi:MAG TPA: metallopeptidase family protein [Nitriliruptorales bacterium]